ncbi:CRISPR-associated ring nuclease Csm6 [Thiohalobacter sp.]|uniref:CRISPR-associated ring nuclease Csm6 n=1 Tax=Thiohalobacter sp. TaxID=2025948 RepID=UPI00262ED3AF|nr:CRISPR-associated ring nuclease Csm6 [Thiohalobacter sp.]
MQPHEYGRRILLAVTGLSPQVVTETVHALAVTRSPAFVPTEVHLVTTAEGRDRARLSLLHPRTGWFHRLRESYGLPEIGFDDTRIHVLEGRNGQPMQDIRSPDDNSAAADFITCLVQELTRDEAAALHVSIAGGRKTMGFYLGYALSLFGRPQDRLSHVLVSAPYESHPHFFFPTRDSEIIYTPAPDNRPHDTRDAVVTLAEIPFVRLRDALETGLTDGACSFLDAVRLAQRAVPPAGLVLRPGACVVVAGGEEVRLEPLRFALYWLLAERALAGQPAVHWTDKGFEARLLDSYGRLVGRDSGDFERAQRNWGQGLARENVDPLKSHVNRTLKRVLGERGAQPYLIRQLGSVPGTRYRRFGLTLGAGQIAIEHRKLARDDGGCASGNHAEVQAGPASSTVNGRIG